MRMKGHMMTTAFDQFCKLKPCHEARVWCARKTVTEAWATCDRGDWMLWLCGKLSESSGPVTRKRLVLCACQCARLSLVYNKPYNTRLLQAIKTAESWANDTGASLEDVRRAVDAAYAASASYVDSVAYAASASVAYAAYASAASVAYAAYASAARSKTLKKCADIVRKFYPVCPLEFE